MLSSVLEVLNGLFVIFMCSEGYIHFCAPSFHHELQLHLRDQSWRRLFLTLVPQNGVVIRVIAPWALINIVVWRFPLDSWVPLSSWWTQWPLSVASSLIGAMEVMGATALVWLLALLLAASLRLIVFTHQPLHITWRQDAIYVSVFTLLAVAVRELGFDRHVRHSELVKVGVLLLLSTTLLFADARRHTNNFTLLQFFVCIGRAVVYATFAFPVAAVVISFGFLVLTSLLRKLGADPEHSEGVNKVVYYGVLYGPLYIVYWHAKRALLRIPNLPW